jgi:Flp pilus assembly pilin Flp
MKQFFKKIKQNESGQGIIEYILLLVVVVAIVMLFRERIETTISGKVNQVGGQIESFGN